MAAEILFPIQGAKERRIPTAVCKQRATQKTAKELQPEGNVIFDQFLPLFSLTDHQGYAALIACWNYLKSKHSIVIVFMKQSTRNTKLKKAIYSVDPLTGLIVACALIRPEKILAPIDLAFVKKRMKEKRFAANANRQPIHDSVEMGIEEDEFITIVLNAMKGISDKIGL